MKRYPFLLLALFVLYAQPSLKAQSTIVPAGTLLSCTLDDPNLSTNTIQVGDPVICHMNILMQFGRPVFPHGAYLGGHIDAAKDPGHFFGKGYLRIEFDRIGLPDTDLPLTAKMVSARDQRVDKYGDIVGKGHAKRDAIEWLFPPLWPWKVIMLPARGPRPKLKSEEVVTLRLMEDVEVPQLRSFSWYQNPTTQSGGTLSGYRSFSQSSTATTPAVPVNNPQVAQSRSAFAASTQQDSSTLTLIALKSQAIYAASDYWVDGANIAYVLPDGSRGVADLRDVDWQRTTDLNVERHVRVTLRRQPASVIYAAAR